MSQAQKPVFGFDWRHKCISLFFLSALIFIHTLDMLVTGHYIGDDWTKETFLPMRLCIEYMGIRNALWVSRICIYVLIYLYLLNWHKYKWFVFLITSTLLYWAAMITWLFTLDILVMPAR